MRNGLFFAKIIYLTFLLIPILAKAQERGVKPVQVNIEGTSTTLYTQSFALLIGVSAYNAGLPMLFGVVEDINLVKSAFEGNGFKVITVMNPDNSGLQKAFTNFIAQYGQGTNNRLLFYFAGHGYTETMPYGDDIGYICPVDAPDPNKNPAGFHEKAIPMRQIETYAYEIKSKHALFLFDACFSGSIFSTSRAIPEVISYKTKEPVRQFISSGSANETVPDKSIFRAQVIRALHGEADGNNDGFVTGTELGEFLQSTVINYSYGSQHPQYGKIRNPNLDKGDFVFVINPETQRTSDRNKKLGENVDSEEAKMKSIDKTFNEFVRSINAIQGNLDTIVMKKNILYISAQNSEIKVYTREQIKSDMFTLYNLMFKIERAVMDLHFEIEKSTIDKTELEKMVYKLNENIIAHDKDIEILRQELSRKNIVIDSRIYTEQRIMADSILIAQRIMKQKTDNQDIIKQITDAYYVIGTKNELIKNEIIKSDEGLLKDYGPLFTKIDKSSGTREILVLSRSARILSKHPTNSYKFIGDMNIIRSLQILDVESFWSLTKYLVIMINQ